MNTEKIEALLLTIKKGSITAAAEEMNYTPSAVSRCIQSLESEWGVRLLSRSKQGVEMTAACEILLPDPGRPAPERACISSCRGYIRNDPAGNMLSGFLSLGICCYGGIQR